MNDGYIIILNQFCVKWYTYEHAQILKDWLWGFASGNSGGDFLFLYKAKCKGFNKSYSGGRLPLPSWRRLHSAKREKRHPANFPFLTPL